MTTDHDAPASDVAFTPAVKRQQERLGSRGSYAKMERRGWSRTIDAELAGFLAEQDSFYLATASAAGQPYVQHRGGPTGFLKVLDERTLAFADFTGNRQYISVGNLSENDRAFLFLMDYPERRRVKIWGRARVVEDDPALLARLSDPDYGGRPERGVVFEVEVWDVNCPQHIRRRFDEDQVAAIVAPLRERIRALEARLAVARKVRPAGSVGEPAAARVTVPAERAPGSRSPAPRLDEPGASRG